MKKLLLILLGCIMSVFVLTSCGKPNLEGIWELCDVNKDGLDIKVKFKDNGKIKFDDGKGEYEVIDKDTINIKIDDKKYKCNFEIVDKKKKLIYIEEISELLEMMNLRGQWTLCTSDGEILDCGIVFVDNKMKILYQSGAWDYEVINKDTLEVKIDGENAPLNFEIIDKERKHIYLAGFSEGYLRGALSDVAKTLARDVNSAVTDIDEEDIYYRKNAIICSDKSKNINPIPENADSDFDFLNDWVGMFFDNIEDYECIIFMQDGVCTKTVIKKPSDDVVGTYPKNEFEGMTFDEIYEEMKKSIE